MLGKKERKTGLLARLAVQGQKAYAYASDGVWADRRDNFWIRLLRVVNLSVRSFLDRGLQKSSMALTYSTVLAVVPALALLFAVARGFGFQNLVNEQLFSYFPSQQKALDTALTFVDSYLKQSSQGAFVGIGIVVLLWTLVSLLSNIEDSFNDIWGVKQPRAFLQKVTDYIAVILLVPVLMILSSGVSIFISTLKDSPVIQNLHLLSPLVDLLLEFLPFLLSWLAFAVSFSLMPNTKVQFKYAAISGFICCILFQLIQWLFLSGQLYVSKYNAIYGSFSFLPLMLVWLQLSWLLILSGCVLTYSMQNVSGFFFLGDIDSISKEYMRKVSVAVASVVYQRQREQEKPLTKLEISARYHLPLRLVDRVEERLYKAGITQRVELPDNDKTGVSPAMDTGAMSLGELCRRLDNLGKSGFIPDFDLMFPSVREMVDRLYGSLYDDKAPLPSVTSDT